MRRALPRSLIARLVGLSLLLLLIVQLAGFAVVRATIERNAHAQIDAAFDGDERAWPRVLEHNADRLTQGATLLAADYGFRSAVLSGDVETVQSVLDNHGRRIGAAVTALLDLRRALVASSTQDMSGEHSAALLQAVGQIGATAHGGRVVVVEGVPYQFVMVPMRAPLTIGWVLMGFPISLAQLQELKQLRSVDVALLVTLPDGSRTVPVSTLPEEVTQQLRRTGAVHELETASQGMLLSRAVPMDSVGGKVDAVILRSVDEVLAPYRRLQVLLGVITLAGVLLFAAANAWMAHRLTIPLRSLIAGTRRLSQGDYAVPMEHTQRRDEIGNLARAFDRMRLDVAAQQAEIHRLAYTDRLTGLPNRERFRQLVVQALQAGGGGARLAVLSLDLHRFKHVNGVLGYSVGDRLLRAVADRIAGQFRSDADVVARMGGNAFAILLPGAGPDEAAAVAQHVQQAFETPLALGDQTLDISAGIGIACWPGPATDADTLLNHAEIAMYVAKQQQHLGCALQYDTSMDSSSPQSLSMLTELRRAVEQNELRIYLQPKVGLTDAQELSAEALLRWQHPERGLVPPMLFIPFAEQTGFVRQLTLWAFGEVARLLAGPALRASGLRVSVNLSAHDLLDPELHHKLGALLQQHGLGAQSFGLEITESAIIDDPARASAMLQRLADMGFRLSIDDFGTGYSSLGYLRRLPVHELKIDKSFVMGMAAADGDAQIVRSTIDLAHNLGLSVVAEGVETAEVLQRLKDLHCDDAQGYFISRPLPVDGFLAWMERARSASGATQ